jgi:hypothetical protein
LTPEVIVSGDRWAVARKRLDVQSLIDADSLPPWIGA